MKTRSIFEGVVDAELGRKPFPTFTPRPSHTDKAIVRCIKKHGGDLSAAAKELGKNQYARVKRVALQNGLFDPEKQPKRGSIKKGDEGRNKVDIDLDRAVALRAGGMTAAEAGRRLGVGDTAIYAKFKKAGRSWGDEAQAMKARLENDRCRRVQIAEVDPK